MGNLRQQWQGSQSPSLSRQTRLFSSITPAVFSRVTPVASSLITVFLLLVMVSINPSSDQLRSIGRLRILGGQVGENTATFASHEESPRAMASVASERWLPTQQ